MPILLDLPLSLDPDRILRAQGANPEVVCARSPKLFELAQRALDLGAPLLEPVVAYREFKIKSMQHERLILSDGGSLAGKTIMRLLAPAKRAVVMVCTVGLQVENLAHALLPGDPGLGMALDGLGTAAVEALTVAACSHFSTLAAAQGLQTTLPLSPGMEGWPTEAGQKQIFRLVPPEEAGIELTSAGMMSPQKSLSLVLGIGEELEEPGRVCDYCAQRLTCRHQDTYA